MKQKQLFEDIEFKSIRGTEKLCANEYDLIYQKMSQEVSTEINKKIMSEFLLIINKEVMKND